jgi:undecaprenyl-diphosphatase
VSLFHVVILSIVQGLAELLPVSSSAHVVVIEKIMGIDPTSPEMTLLLVMLHSGTMFAVIAYFWRRWRLTFFRDSRSFVAATKLLIIGTALTGLIGEILVVGIERFWLRGRPHAEVEELFGHLGLISIALAAAGVLILLASAQETRAQHKQPGDLDLTLTEASIVGVVQGLCLPFRGFSRSGATISIGMLLGIDKVVAEDFSFALAVLLTPPVVLRELLRVVRAQGVRHQTLLPALSSGVLGGVCAFLAGLLALRWLSRWLESGRWQWFGIYCLVAAAAVAMLYYAGF